MLITHDVTTFAIMHSSKCFFRLQQVRVHLIETDSFITLFRRVFKSGVINESLLPVLLNSYVNFFRWAKFSVLKLCYLCFLEHLPSLENCYS